MNDRYLGAGEMKRKLHVVEESERRLRRERCWHLFAICRLKSRVIGAERTKLQRGADIAQAFLNDKGDGYYFLLGRIQAVYSNASGSFKAAHAPIDLASKPAGGKHVCRWYSRKKQGKRRGARRDERLS